VQLAEGQQLGPAVLFFGCRNRAHDYIYEAELAAAVDAGALSKLHVAFSRASAQKDYVQHHMAAQAAELWGLLQQPDAVRGGGGGAGVHVRCGTRGVAPLAQRHGGTPTPTCTHTHLTLHPPRVARTTTSGRVRVW
jgi:hypothetical protein